MYNKIAEILLTPGKRATTTSEIFVAQPDANKELLAGKLFILIEIESKRAEDLKIINFLIENLNNNYYQNEKIILRERVATVKVEHIFESALAKTNKNLAEFIRAEKIKINPRTINATVGIIFENTLLFSNVGKNKAFLIYKSKDNAPAQKSTGQKKYNITNVAGGEEENEKKNIVNSAKMFSNVISGTIPKYGYFIFTNEALPEYLSGRQLVEIITTLPPLSAAEQIKNDLLKINYYVSFLGLIIKNAAGYEAEEIVKVMAKPSTQESISNLNLTEEKTEKLLAPKGYVNFGRWLNFPAKLFSLARIKIFGSKKAKPLGASENLLRDKIFFRKKANLIFLKKIGSLFRNIFIYLINFFVYLYKLLTDREKLLELSKKIKNIPFVFYNKIKNIYPWFKNLGLKNKILFVAAIIFLFLFSQNILIKTIKNNKVEKEKEYTNLIKPIEQKLNQVEASLLYGNEDSARLLLGEVKNLLGELPQKSNSEKEQYKKYDDKYNAMLEKISNVVKIANPRELADFSKLDPEANTENIAFSPLSGKIYAADSSRKSIYGLDLKDNAATFVAKNNQLFSGLKHPSLAKDENIYYFNGNEIIQINTKTNEIKPLSISIKNGVENIVSMASFNNKLYLIDKKEGQIYSYKKEGAGFPGASIWLKKTADLSNATGIAIDGSIYILKKTGQTLKYLKGAEEEFNLTAPEPGMEDAKKIMVSPELNYIYILEPAKNRLIIFNKEGKFLMQYKSDKFNNIKDFTVNEEKKNIYFLNGNSVYEVPGEHFK